MNTFNHWQQHDVDEHQARVAAGKRLRTGAADSPKPDNARLGDSSRPLDCPSQKLNKTEARWCRILEGRLYNPVWKQAITLALDPPFRSYRPDLAYIKGTYLTFVEVKGPHRFREKGIAKAALAAKSYPQFRFELVEWTGSGWKESVLSS